MEAYRILHVIRPAEGGMKGHLLTLVAGLIDQGLCVEVACPGESLLAEELDRSGVVVHPINLVGPINPGTDLLCVRQLKEIIAKGSFNLVHFHGSKAGLVGRIAAFLAGCKKTVLTVHNFIVYEEITAFKKMVFRLGEKALSGFTSGIITVSEALRDDLVENYGIDSNKITVIYNGIDLSKYRSIADRTKARAVYGIEPGIQVVGTVARMAPQKGLNYLIEAIPAVLEKEDVFFIIAGDGPLREGLEEMVKIKGLKGNVLFPGYVEDIPGLMACFDVFVIPSIAEGLSITTIEAMAAGLPVVAARVGGLPELVREGQNGYLVEPRDPDSLSKALLDLLRDPGTRKTMGIRGRQTARGSFDTEMMLNRTLEVYNTLIGE